MITEDIKDLDTNQTHRFYKIGGGQRIAIVGQWNGQTWNLQIAKNNRIIRGDYPERVTPDQLVEALDTWHYDTTW